MPANKAAVAAALWCISVPNVYAIDNGLGLLPPMGWRSWNCYHGNVNQTLMEGVMDAMASRKRSVDGKPTSLLDLGYANCGLDDNWQACGAGPLKGFHDADGNPIINTKTFPNMSAMTAHGHSLGLRVGWYMNNCICGEHQYTTTSKPTVAQVMERSAAAVADYGFDGVKLDGCSQFRNLTWWASLLNATGREILIENCHWGGTVPGDTSGDGPCSGTTTPSDCPYNFFRTSGDISNNWNSMFNNLQTTVKFSGEQGATPLSRPGAYAYPDMLEVGRMPSPEEDRTHFAAWCIASAPLVLGFDLTDDDAMDKVWDIIANPEAIAVSQTWEGSPGHLVQGWSPGISPAPAPPSDEGYVWAVDCNAGDKTQVGFSYNAADQTIRFGTGNYCFDASNQHALQIKPCVIGKGQDSQQFELDNATSSLHQGGKCVDVYDLQGPVVQLYSCNGGTNQHFTFNPDGKSKQIKAGSGQCLANKPNAPGPGTDSMQLWTKPLAKGAAAALVINADNGNRSATVHLSDLNLTGTTYTVRDVFNRKDLGTVTSPHGYTTDAIVSHDSRFLVFTPK